MGLHCLSRLHTGNGGDPPSCHDEELSCKLLTLIVDNGPTLNAMNLFSAVLVITLHHADDSLSSRGFKFDEVIFK